MANYSLILDTQFKPFTYAEMLAPIAAATEAHQNLEEGYAALEAEANMWDKIANEEPNSMAANMYRRYIDDLHDRADTLMRQGLSPESRRGMLNMKARYSNEILPIETAYKRRETLATEQRQTRALNPTALFQREARDMSIDEFINNPSLDYGHTYSGAMLAKQVGDMAANLAKEARESEAGRRRLEQLLPFQYRYALKYGFSSEAVMQAILNEEGANEILTNMVEQAIDSSGIRTWGNSRALEDAYAYARQGLWNAVGTTQYQMLTDQYNMQNALAEDEARRRAAAAEAELTNLTPYSFFDESGELRADVLDKLEMFRANDGVGIQRGYVGSRGDINPLMLRREVELKFRQLGGDDYSTWKNMMLVDDNLYKQRYILEQEDKYAQAEAYVLNKYKLYGVTKLIPRSRDGDYSIYETIFANGTPRQYLSFEDDLMKPVLEHLNTQAQRKSYYSVNLTDYGYPSERFKGSLHHWDDTDTFEGRAYKVEEDGKKGGSVDLDDIIPDSNTKLTDIFYNVHVPDRVMVEVETNTGDRNRFYVDPEVFGSDVANLVDRTNSEVQAALRDNPNEDLTLAATETTKAIKHFVNNLNPVASRSSSHAEY